MHTENDTLIILTPGFAASETDSNCLPMQQSLVRTLKKNHPDLNIIILSFHYPFFKKQYDWFGARVISFGGKNKGGLYGIFRRRRVNATLRELHRRYKIIGLLSFWFGESAAVGKKFADKNGLKHFCWILGQDAREGNKYIKYLRPRAAELIALSDFIQDEFERNHQIRPATVIPPGVDPVRFVKQSTGRDIDILAAGSLIPLKQYDVFIDMIAEIKKRVPGLKAMLIGNGRENARLQQRIIEKGLELTITLAGELPHSGVLALMQQAKVFLHPSSYEGFGVVCLEALQAGCQVISFCKPMKQDIEQWHIVKDQHEMEQKTIDILHTSPLSRSITVFSIDDTAEKMIGLFNS